MSKTPAPTGHHENRMMGLIIRLMAIFFISIMAACVKLAGQQGVHIVESLFWRQLTGLPVVMLWLYWNNASSEIRTNRPWSHAIRMILGLTGMALNYSAMTMLPLAESATIGFAVPIFSAVMAAIILKEATGPWRWSAIIIGFVGVLIVVQPNGAAHGIGTLIGMAGALATAAVTIQIRTLSKRETTGSIVFWFSLSSLVPLGIAMPFFAGAHNGLSWAYIAGLSLSGACAQICLTASLRYAPVSVVMPMDYSALLWGTLYGWLIFDQLPASSTWIGAPIIIAAGILIAWREHHLQLKSRAATTAAADFTPAVAPTKTEQV